MTNKRFIKTTANYARRTGDESMELMKPLLKQ
jgi:hypothetical protein